MDYILETLKLHGPWAAFVLIIGYIGKSHLDADKELAERVKALEETSVKKTDIERLETRFDDLGEALHTGQREILQTLLATKR